MIGHSIQETAPWDPAAVFIVHGHDHESKNELELFVKELGLLPVVLHRQPDEGLTIIEKFEKHSRVGYALVLLTPDDFVEGGVNQGNGERRARQNVVFEFGFFVGRLGRNRVCCIHKSGTTLPSDVSGLIYKPFKHRIEEVKFALAKELKSAGYNVQI